MKKKQKTQQKKQHKKQSANKSSHFTYEERVIIEALLKEEYSYQHIATNLSRGKSSVGEEVQRNGGKKKYKAKKAHQRAYLRQYRKKQTCNKVALSRFLTRFVERKLRLGWSPERIASRLRFLKKKRSETECASAKSIRKYIQKRSGLEAFLFFRRMKKRKKTKRGAWLTATRRFVDSMPKITGFGTFEVDFIVSAKSTAVLLVLVDVVTKLTLIRLLPNRNNEAVNTAIVTMLEPYEVQTLIPDNDIAFAKHEALAETLGADIYFARPYRSTDKPLVENSNRWIRSCGMPKKTDLETVSTEHVRRVEEWFNNTPRECLGGMTPMEKIAELEGRAIIIENYPRHPVLSPRAGLASVFGG